MYSIVIILLLSIVNLTLIRKLRREGGIVTGFCAMVSLFALLFYLNLVLRLIIH
jgi:hypothetical protein